MLRLLPQRVNRVRRNGEKLLQLGLASRATGYMLQQAVQPDTALLLGAAGRRAFAGRHRRRQARIAQLRLRRIGLRGRIGCGRNIPAQWIMLRARHRRDARMPGERVSLARAPVAANDERLLRARHCNVEQIHLFARLLGGLQLEQGLALPAARSLIGVHRKM